MAWLYKIKNDLIVEGRMRKCFNEAVEKFYPFICMVVCKWVLLSCFSRVPLFETPWAVTHQAPLSWDSPGKNTGVCCHSLLQGIFPTQGYTLFSCIGRWFFTTNTPWEALAYIYVQINSNNLQDF